MDRLPIVLMAQLISNKQLNKSKRKRYNTQQKVSTIKATGSFNTWK
jgi:hypothetical protein